MKLVSIFLVYLLLVGVVFGFDESDFNVKEQIVLNNYTEGYAFQLINFKFYNDTLAGAPLNLSDPFFALAYDPGNGTLLLLNFSSFNSKGHASSWNFQNGTLDGITNSCGGGTTCDNFNTVNAPELNQTLRTDDNNGGTSTDVFWRLNSSLVDVYVPYCVYPNVISGTYGALIRDTGTNGVGYLRYAADGSIELNNGAFQDSGYDLTSGVVTCFIQQALCSSNTQDLFIELDLNKTLLNPFSDESIPPVTCSAIGDIRFGSFFAVGNQNDYYFDSLGVYTEDPNVHNSNYQYLRGVLPSGVSGVYLLSENNTPVSIPKTINFMVPQYEESAYSVVEVNAGYVVNSTSYADPILETNVTNYTLQIWTNASTVSDVLANLVVNGVSEGNNSKSNSSFIFNFIDSFASSLVLSNSSSIYHQWNITIVYVNGTNTTFSTTNSSQSVYWAFYPSNFYSSLGGVETYNFSEGQTDTAIMLIADPWNDGRVSFSAKTEFNETVNYTMGQESYANSTQTYSAEVFMPEINTNNVTILIEPYFYVNSSFRREFASHNITLFNLGLVFCSDPLTNTVALNFTMWDETNQTAITNFNMDSLFNVSVVGSDHTHEYNITSRNVDFVEICVYPPNAVLWVDSFQQFWKDPDYPTRTYILNNATVNNVTEDVYLYGLESALSTPITLTVFDEFSAELEGAIVQVQRYYIGESAFKTVASGLTDSNGQATVPLELYYTYYRFVVIDGDTGEVLGTFGPQLLTDVELTLRLSEELLGEIFSYLGDIAGSCVEGTYFVNCTVVDSSGLMVASSLEVLRTTTYTSSIVCDLNSTSASTTFACNLGNTTGASYFYTLRSEFSDAMLTLDSGFMSFATSPDFGVGGLLATIIVSLGLFLLFSSISGLGVGVVGGGVGILGSTSLGLVNLDYGASMGIFGLTLVLGFLIQSRGNRSGF